MDKQIIIDETEINPNDWLEPYKPIPACEIKDCNYLVYAGDNIYGCRIAEDGLVCDDFNNDDECCMYRQLEYYKEALKRKEQECERLKSHINCICFDPSSNNNRCISYNRMAEDYERDLKQLDQLKAENAELKYKAEFFENYNNAHINKITKLEKTLTEIKELCQKHIKAEKIVMANDILQKISECEVKNDNA